MSHRAIEIINSVPDHRHGERAMLAVTQLNDTHDPALAVPTEADSGFVIPATDLVAAIEAADGPTDSLLVHIWTGAAYSTVPVLAIADGRIQADVEQNQVRVDKRAVPFTQLEFSLLKHLSVNVDLALDKRSIYENVWGQEPYVGQLASVNQYVTRVRRKLGKELGDPKEGAIRTIHNFGFKAMSQLVETDHA